MKGSGAPESTINGESASGLKMATRLTQARFARAIGVSPMRISHVVNGTRPVSAELALRIGRALGQSPQYWLNLQTMYDLKMAEAAIGEKLADVADLVAA